MCVNAYRRTVELENELPFRAMRHCANGGTRGSTSFRLLRCKLSGGSPALYTEKMRGMLTRSMGSEEMILKEIPSLRFRCNRAAQAHAFNIIKPAAARPLEMQRAARLPGFFPRLLSSDAFDIRF